MPGASVREHAIHPGYRAVTLENDTIRVTVLPGKGAEIHSLVFKARNLDPLWKAPWGLKRHGAVSSGIANSEAAWMDTYAGGWQEIFPNGGDACIYQGAPLGFHGEASVSMWDYAIRASGGQEVSVDFTVMLARSPFTLRRTMKVDSSRPVLSIFEEIVNDGSASLHFMWGHHPAFGAPFLGPDCRIQTPAATFEGHDTEISSNCRIRAGAVGSWPLLSGKGGSLIDLSRVPPESEPVAEFGYLSGLSEGWYTLDSPRHGCGIAFSWPVSVFPYLWFWQELRGSLGYPWYGRSYVMAIEPFTSIPGSGLLNAITRGTAPVLGPGERIRSTMCAVFYDGCGDVDSVSPTGDVKFA